MYLSSKFFRFAFGVSGDKIAVPDDIDPSGYVSYEEGFPPDYELPKTDPSRKPVPRDETNQLYYDISSGVQQYQKYSVPEFITAADNDGVAFSYAKGVRVMYTADAGATWNIYRSLVAANNVLPPSDPAKWALDNEYPVASETVSGIQENATQAETNAGSSDAKTVTPLKLRYGFAISLAANGYIAFPAWLSGLIIQWGNGAYYNGSGGYTETVAMPMTFPTNVLWAGLSTQHQVGDLTSVNIWALYGVTASTITGVFNKWAAGSEYSRFNFIAIGY